MLKRAHEAAYGTKVSEYRLAAPPSVSASEKAVTPPKIIKQEELKPGTQSHKDKFNIGDSVFVYPKKEIGIVYARANDKGEIGVQVKGVKKLVNHKRLKLLVSADELYPENYDFSIIFDTVANRKARHIMGKRHEEGNVVIIKEGETEK
jgi:hypothetical protein